MAGEGRGRPDVRFSEATPEEFLAALRGNTRAWNLTEHTAEELGSARVFLSEDGKTGIAVAADGDIQNAFRNPDGVPGSGSAAVAHAIAHGGITLDCYDGFLPKLYAKHGMVVTGRMKFNPEYAPEGMPAGETPDVVFMGLNAQRSDRYYDDWDEAKAASRKAAKPRLERAASERIEELVERRASHYNPNQPRDPGGEAGGQWVPWNRPGADEGVIAPWKETLSKKSPFPASEVTMASLTPEEQQKIRDAWEDYTGKPWTEVEENLREVFEMGVATQGTEGLNETMGTPNDAFTKGKVWYHEVNGWAEERAAEHKIPMDMVAGAISAMSPQTEWSLNQKYTGMLLAYYAEDPARFRSMSFEEAADGAIAYAKENGVPVALGGGKRNFRWASRILQGEPVGDVLTQAKTRGFYNSILDPDNPYDVVMDIHMINASYGGDTPGPAGLLIEVPPPPRAEKLGIIKKPADWKKLTLVKPPGAKFTPIHEGAGWFTTPSIRLQQIGVQPLVADAVREITDDWNAEHPKEKLVPLQTQAIIWSEWVNFHGREKTQATKSTQDATIEAEAKRLGIPLQVAKSKKRADWWL